MHQFVMWAWIYDYLLCSFVLLALFSFGSSSPVNESDVEPSNKYIGNKRCNLPQVYVNFTFNFIEFPRCLHMFCSWLCRVYGHSNGGYCKDKENSIDCICREWKKKPSFYPLFYPLFESVCIAWNNDKIK